MNSVIGALETMYGVPTLKSQAQKALFNQLDLVLPSWTTAIVTENLQLQDKLRFVTRDYDRLRQRLRSRKRRIREALHESRYKNQRMEEIEEFIDKQWYRRAQSELRTLRSLNYVQNELQQIYSLIRVS